MIDREYFLLKHNEEALLDESGYHHTCLSIGDWHRLEWEMKMFKNGFYPVGFLFG